MQMSKSPSTALSSGRGKKMKEAENIEHLSVIDGMARESRVVCGLAAVEEKHIEEILHFSLVSRAYMLHVMKCCYKPNHQ
ncbi:hypothetical protein F2P79_009001 [Pimephales promelas]|nr:hypothetical protein F2P79_009001 [Pimephales promelas]